MKFKDKHFVKKAVKLIKGANKRGLITSGESAWCDYMAVFVYKNRLSILGANDSRIDIKL